MQDRYIEDRIKHCCGVVGRKLKEIDIDLRNVEKDVEKDLERLADEQLKGVNNPEIKERIEKFKNTSKSLLVEARKKSLEHAKQRLLNLQSLFNKLQRLTK